MTTTRYVYPNEMDGSSNAARQQEQPPPQLFCDAPSEVVDRIRTMRIQERSDAYRCVDYLAYARRGANKAKKSRCQKTQEQPPIDAECRSKMCEWSCSVVDFCQFSRETVSIAMNYLDRFLTSSVTTGNPAATRARVSRREYQLASMTALYVAVKLHEPLEMDTELVSEMSRGVYSPIEIADTEADILAALGWRTSGPTPLGFLSHFLALLPKNDRTRQAEIESLLLDYGRAQSEYAVYDYHLVPLLPSTVAVAALLNALEGVPGTVMTTSEKIAFLRRVRDVTGIDLMGDEVRFARSRLQDAFAEEEEEEEQSAEEAEEQADAAEAEEQPKEGTKEPELQTEEEECHQNEYNENKCRSSVTRSPTCVSQRHSL